MFEERIIAKPVTVCNMCSSVAAVMSSGGSKEYNSAFSYQHLTTQKATNHYPLDKALSNK